MRKYLALVSLSVLMVSSASAQGMEPSHPLSQIHPIDVPLNMSEEQVINVSRFSLENGLSMEGREIRDQGGMNILIWNSSAEKWEVVNGDVDLNNNTLENPDQISTDGSGDDTFDIRDEAVGEDMIRFEENGEIEALRPIDLNDNVLTDSNGSLEIEGGVYMPTGNLDMAGNNVVNPGFVDGIDLDNPGNGLGVVNSRLVVVANSISNQEINNSDSFTLDGINATSNIDMNGNNITDIDTLIFETGMKINGSINTSGGSVNLENGSINDVDSIDGGGDPVRFDDDIDLEDNDLIEPDELRTGGSSGDVIAVRDTANGQDIIRFREGGNVDVPSGGIDVASTSTIGDLRITPNAPGAQFGVDETGSLTSDSAFVVRQDRSNNRLDFNYQTGASGDALNTQTGLSIDGSGSVNVPNGNLEMRGNGIREVSHIRANTAFPEIRTRPGGDGVDEWQILDSDTGEEIAKFREGGQTQLIDSSTGNLILDANPEGNQNVEIPNGDLELAQYSNVEWNNEEVRIHSAGNGELQIRDGASTSLEIDTDTDEVNIPNGNLDLQGNRMVDTTSSNTVYVGDGSDDQVVLDAVNNVQVQSGNLNMNGNSITQFFDNECPSGESVIGVNNNGSYDCIDITNEVSDVYVNRSGDSMTGDLDMRGNDIYDVGNMGVGTDSPQENLDVDGDASIESGGTRMEVDSGGNVVVTLGS